MANTKSGNVKQSKTRAPKPLKTRAIRKSGERVTTIKDRYTDVIKKVTDQGHIEFQHRGVEKEGEVMEIAERTVLTVYPTTTVKAVATLMENNDFRRLPVVNAGTGRLEGMAVAIDILDFFGGGEKYNIILNDFKGNFLSAINCPIRKIMIEDYSVLNKTASFDDVVNVILEKHHSAIPIVDGNNKVVGIVTERDILPTVESLGVCVGDVMHRNIITSSRGMMISDASKIMVRNRKRRLPVLENDRIVGVITVFDILRFFAKGNFKGVKADEVLSERVDKVMATDITTVSPNQDVSDVLKLIDETGFGGFPVVEDNQLIGLITISDIIKEIYT